MKWIGRIVLGLALIATTSTAGNYPSKRDLERWRLEREAQGIYNSIKLYPDTSEIEFTYGSPEHRRMSFADFAAFVKERLSDQTAVAAPSSIGYQIEYYGPDGHAYLWYPGNNKTVVGTYEIRQSMAPLNVFGDKAGVVICFNYGPDSYNPSTGKVGGEECQSAYAFIAAIRGKRQGDVFKITSGALPFTMTKDQYPVWPDGKLLMDEKAPHY
jgi:hypothetical protein